MAYIGKTPTIGNFQKCDAISVVNGQAAYTMQVNSVNVEPQSVNHMLVSLNGILQAPTDSYTISGSTITFASNLATGDVIDFIMILGNVLDLGVPSDNTVSTAKLVDSAVTSAKINDGAITSGKLASGVGGKVLQVVSDTSTSAISSTSTTFAYVTNAPSVDITPSSTSSKILILSHFGSFENSAGTGAITIFRDSTNLGDSSNGVNFHQPDGTTYAIGGVSLLDSPATTSQITYQVRIKNTGGTIEISRGSFSTITAIEVGA